MDYEVRFPYLFPFFAPEDYVNLSSEEIRLARARISEIYSRRPEFTLGRSEDEKLMEIRLYWILRAVASQVPHFRPRFVDYYVERTRRFLGEYREALEADLGISRPLKVTEYLKYPLYDCLALANQEVKGGMLDPPPEFLFSVLREKLSTFEPVEVNAELINSVPAPKIHSVEGFVPEALPPCISRLYNRILSGEKLSHMENFLLAVFLINVGLGEEEIVRIFSHAPNFNEKITRYQVEFLMGKRGGGKKYMVPSCDKIRSMNLCVADCSVTNPLVYYRRRAWKKKRGTSGNTTRKPS